MNHRRLRRAVSCSVLTLVGAAHAGPAPSRAATSLPSRTTRAARGPAATTNPSRASATKNPGATTTQPLQAPTLPHGSLCPIGTLHGAGQSFVVDIPGPQGDIAALVSLPKSPRFDCAPVVVNAPFFFTPDGDDGLDDDFVHFTELGMAEITFLWPGRCDSSVLAGSEMNPVPTTTEVCSDGVDDFGGAGAIAAFVQVLRFAAGLQPTSLGHTIRNLSLVPIDIGHLGLYGYSHQGIAAVNALVADAGVSGVDWFIGRENPTSDELSALEAGWYSGAHAVLNPTYSPSTDYTSSGVVLDYATVSWDAAKQVPYLDANGDHVPSCPAEFCFGPNVPRMFGKKVYSPVLTGILESKMGSAFPSSVIATAAESKAWWADRETPAQYSSLPADLHSMLVFGATDHAQPGADKPHIHMAYDGLRTRGRWVRLNPDDTYMEQFSCGFPTAGEHPADSSPGNWYADATSWGHQNDAHDDIECTMAAGSEMADRQHSGNWSVDL